MVNANRIEPIPSGVDQKTSVRLLTSCFRIRLWILFRIKKHLKAGRTEVYDADLSKYFDTIPHGKLVKTLEMRISDPRIWELIKKWLKAPVYDNGQYTGGRKSIAGTPQGGVISPLLANIYLHLLDRLVTDVRGMFAKAGIHIVRYADGFVLIGQRMPEVAVTKMREMLQSDGITD